MFPRKLKN